MATLVAFGGVGVAFAGGEDLLRPPGGQDENNLFSACIRCDRCRSVCPAGVVGVATIENGFTQMRMPKMDFRRSYCDTCDGEYKCIEVCPTCALLPFDKETQKIGMAVIDYDKCLVYGISGTCSGKCVEHCPENALSFNENNRLILDEDLCWGCGICEFVCPANAYGTYSGTTKRGINIAPWKGTSHGEG